MSGRPDSNPPVTVLLVSSHPDDHRYFQCFCDLRKWALHHAWSLARATELLNALTIPVVVADETLSHREWLALLEAGIPNPPNVIIAPRKADRCSGREAGSDAAIQVLARPFRDRDVFRAVTLAWLAWELRVRLGWKLEWSLAPRGACSPRHD